LLLFSLLIYFFISRFFTHWRLRVYGNNLLSYVFITNNLYELDEYINSSGKIKERLIYWPQAYYKINDDVLEVSIRLDGSKYQEKLKDLGDNFSQRLVCPLESYELKNGHVIYEYSLKSQASYNVDESLEGGIRNLDYIPITQSIIWEYDKAPHALVTGQTGKGKTYLLF